MPRYFRCVEGVIERHAEFRASLLSEHPDALHWIDLEDPSPQEATLLEDPFRFHPLAIEDCLAEVHHAKVDDYEDRLNETMKRMTVVTAVLACLTVIAGIYGMNFEQMPELKWRFGYAWALGLMLAVPTGLIVFFRRKGWI